MKYVVTEYWNNGGCWEDEEHREQPIKVFKNIVSALKYISAYGKIESQKNI